eukprot:429245-Pelagomonas_calceolata.AAC.3
MGLEKFCPKFRFLFVDEELSSAGGLGLGAKGVQDLQGPTHCTHISIQGLRFVAQAIKILLGSHLQNPHFYLQNAIIEWISVLVQKF